MLRGAAKPVDLLTTYLNIWTGRMEKDDPANAVLSELRLAGVVRTEGGYMRVKNPLYQRVFDQNFVDENQPRDETFRQRQAERRGRMQVLVWASGLAGAFAALASSESTPALGRLPLGVVPAQLLAFVAFFLIGFAQYATLQAAAASLISRTEDLGSFSGPLVLPVVAGFLIAQFALYAPNAPVVVAASFIPFVAPFVMFTRMSL